MVLSGGKGERLYFYFAGHGLTTRVSNRDESAVLATDFTNINTDQSLALRSLWEFFETTQFEDQFLFVDACRNVPPWDDGAEFELGRWTLPRSRDPGTPPVQQFILYATSPKLKAGEIRGTPGQEHGAFTAALLEGLSGAGRREGVVVGAAVLRGALGAARRLRQSAASRRRRSPSAARPTRRQLQIPQDTGSRGVAGRDRDALLTSFPDKAFPNEQLQVAARARQRVPRRRGARAEPARRRRRAADRVHGRLGHLRARAGDVRPARSRAGDRRGPRVGADRAVRGARRAAAHPAAAARRTAAGAAHRRARAAGRRGAGGTRSVDLESVGTGTIPIRRPTR